MDLLVSDDPASLELARIGRCGPHNIALVVFVFVVVVIVVIVVIIAVVFVVVVMVIIVCLLYTSDAADE